MVEVFLGQMNVMNSVIKLNGHIPKLASKYLCLYSETISAFSL